MKSETNPPIPPGGIARRLIDFAKVLVGTFPGGLVFDNWYNWFILKLKMWDEEKLRRAFSVICHSLDKIREDIELLKLKLDELERKLDNLFSVKPN